VPPALAMREKPNLGAVSKRGKGCRLAKAASTLFVVGLQNARVAGALEWQ